MVSLHWAKILILIMVCCPILGLSQSSFPYQLTWKRQGIIAGATIGLGAVDLVLRNQVEGFTEAELQLLDPSTIPAYERGVTERYSVAASHRSDIGGLLAAGAGVAVPASVFFQGDSSLARSQRWRQLGTLAVLWTEVNLITGLGTDLVKSVVLRPRPFTYNTLAPLEERLDPDARKSFFSGHTSLTAANAFFAAKVFADIYPDSKWKPWVWGGAALVPAWVGTERVLAGKHFPTDVVYGYLFGATIGILLPEIHKTPTFKRKQRAGMQVQLYPVSTVMSSGMGLSLRF